MSYTPPPKCPGVTPSVPGVVIEATTPTPLYLLGPTSPWIGVKGQNINCEPSSIPWPPNACPVVLGSDCVYYVGDALPNTGIQIQDTLTEVLVKIDTVITGGDKTFVFVQALVSAIWTVFHDMDKYPSVTAIDNGGTKQEGFINYVDLKNLTITYSSGFAGKAYLN